MFAVSRVWSILPDHSYYSLASTVLSRGVGMGGAVTAVQDGLSNTIFNPALMEFYKYPQTFQLTCFLNPVGGIAAIQERHKLSVKENYDSFDWMSVAGIFVKGIAVTSRSLSVGLLLSEQLPGEKLSAQGLLDRNYNALTARLSLADQVAIGVSGFLFNSLNGGNRQRLFGTSYGVFIQPTSKFSVGIAYHDLPNEIQASFLQNSRIVDETINVGISYQPFTSLLLAADLRNATEETESVTRELHLGMELMPFRFCALRGGYFQDEITHHNIISAGIGLFHSHSFTNSEGLLVYPDFIINYAFQVDDRGVRYDLYHFLTLLVRL
jgi:hypothetical protein